jgi:hypothetical protein
MLLAAPAANGGEALSKSASVVPRHTIVLEIQVVGKIVDIGHHKVNLPNNSWNLEG